MEKNKKFHVEYTGVMDPLCIPLCDALNSCSGIKTVESCCGHGNEPYRIWFKCLGIDSYGLSVITRAVDSRYSGTNLQWSIKLETVDEIDEGYMSVCFLLESNRPYITEEEMKQNIDQIIENITEWSDPKYADFFGMIRFYSPNVKF